MMLSLLAGVAWAECITGPTNNASLQRQVESAFFSFVELDDTGFEAYRSSAVQSVFCLDELIHPHLAAEFLRLEGVRAFTARNEPFASAAFRAARTLEPQHRLPTTLAPAGGPLHKLYTQSSNLPVIPWELPSGGFRSYVNGIPSTTTPNGIAVVQLVLPDGTLPFSGVVTQRADLPADLLASLPKQQGVLKPKPLDEDRPAGPEKSAKGAVAATSLVAALAAGSLLGVSAYSRLRYDTAPTKQRRQMTNLLFFGSAGTGVVTLGLGVAAVALPGKRR